MERLPLLIGMPGGWEWFVILAVALLIFGKRLPEVARAIGKAFFEFKKGIQGAEEELKAESKKEEENKEDKTTSQRVG